MKKAGSGGLPRTALKVFGFQIAFGFFGFMFTPALIGAAPAIRIPIVGLLILIAGFLMFMEGSFRGERECAHGETLDKLARKGTYKASEAENAMRYRRSKGIVTALLGALPLVLAAAYLAATARPYAYTLQDLPGWMATYLPRAEIGEPLQYLRDVSLSATVTDYVRVAVRFALFPYVGLLGEMSDATSLLFDRVSPLLMLIMPLTGAIGYQFGPARRAKSVKEIEAAKRMPRKRLKKDRAKKGPGEKEKKQLI